MVFEKLKEIICDYFEIEEEEFTPEASFLMDFGFDELDMADLSMDVEDIFEIIIDTPTASCKTYEIIVTDGNDTITLKNIVFGELWIASGQSNMQYPLAQASGGKEDAENHKKQSEYIRVMTMPIYDKSIDSKSYYDTLPYEEQNDVKF